MMGQGKGDMVTIHKSVSEPAPKWYWLMDLQPFHTPLTHHIINLTKGGRMDKRALKKIMERHELNLKMKTLKKEVTYKLNKINGKLAAFFEECSLYEDGKTLIALTDNDNSFIIKVLNTDKHIILDAITDMTNLYNDINFSLLEEDNTTYHLRCSTNRCINLPKEFISKMNWKVGDEISIWEHSIDDAFGIGKDLEGIDLMKKEDRDILTAHEDVNLKN